MVTELPVKLLIIADDLTGAMDSSEPFAKAGASVAVATSIDGCHEAIATNPEVLAINTESRVLTADEANASVTDAWQRIAGLDPEFVFKKIDSRLKGNIGTETDAMLRASRRSRIIVAPAIPSMGRFVIDGAVTGFGVEQPLRIADCFADGARIEVPDCSSEAMLADVAEHIVSAGRSRLAVGAKGLADGMAAALERRGDFTRKDAKPVSLAGERLIMLIGSRDPITLGQLDHLKSSGIAMDVIDAPNGIFDPRQISENRQIIVIAATPGSDAVPTEAVAQNMGRRGYALVGLTGVRNILASGGDTATAFVHSAGIPTLQPVGEVAPGIPVSTADAPAGMLKLITKSGGFGERDSLTEIARRLMISQ